MDKSILVNIDDGIVIVLVGIAVVFVALFLLFITFQHVAPFILGLLKRKKALDRQKLQVPVVEKVSSGEEIAAVTTAVWLYLEEVHDQENPIITIGKSSKDYSPWSSKIYTTHNALRTLVKR